MFDSSPAYMKIKIEIIADVPDDTTITDIHTLEEMIKGLDHDRPFDFESIDNKRI